MKTSPTADTTMMASSVLVVLVQAATIVKAANVHIGHHRIIAVEILVTVLSVLVSMLKMANNVLIVRVPIISIQKVANNDLSVLVRTIITVKVVIRMTVLSVHAIMLKVVRNVHIVLVPVDTMPKEAILQIVLSVLALIQMDNSRENQDRSDHVQLDTIQMLSIA